jgi:hypothetical protein
MQLAKRKADLTALRRSITADGNSQVNVTYWVTTYLDGELNSMAVVDPVDPGQMVFNLYVGILSEDQSIIYTSGWGIPEINNDQPFCPGVGMANDVWTTFFDPSKQGSIVAVEIYGVVGTPDHQQSFSFKQFVNLNLQP